jgi:hypothetical protein
VAVEVLLSTVGPNFTGWVGAAQKVNGVHPYNFVQMHTAQLVTECQQLAKKINMPKPMTAPILDANNLGFLWKQKMVLLPAIIRIKPVHAFL